MGATHNLIKANVFFLCDLVTLKYGYMYDTELVVRTINFIQYVVAIDCKKLFMFR